MQVRTSLGDARVPLQRLATTEKATITRDAEKALDALWAQAEMRIRARGTLNARAEALQAFRHLVAVAIGKARVRTAEGDLSAKRFRRKAGAVVSSGSRSKGYGKVVGKNTSLGMRVVQIHWRGTQVTKPIPGRNVTVYSGRVIEGSVSPVRARSAARRVTPLYAVDIGEALKDLCPFWPFC